MTRYGYGVPCTPDRCCRGCARASDERRREAPPGTGGQGRWRGQVRSGHGAAYAQDASNYRQVPIGVVLPKTADAAVEAIAVCRELGVPVLSRGGGTSLAGQCVNEAVVIDWTKYCHQLISVDQGAKTAVIQPGMALDKANDALAGSRPDGRAEAVHARQLHDRRHDREQLLRVDGPRPTARWSTRCGGSRILTLRRAGATCGSAKPATRTTRRSSRPAAGRPRCTGGCGEIRDAYLGQIRTGYPKIPRRVSGYNLDSLLPERGFHVARALVGSESTLGHRAARGDLRWSSCPSSKSLVVLGYPDIAEAADVVPLVVRHSGRHCWRAWTTR